MRPAPIQPPADPPAGPKAEAAAIVHRRRQVAGLLLIALIVLVASVWRAGLASVFPAGWWRLW